MGKLGWPWFTLCLHSLCSPLPDSSWRIYCCFKTQCHFTRSVGQPGTLVPLLWGWRVDSFKWTHHKQYSQEEMEEDWELWQTLKNQTPRMLILILRPVFIRVIALPCSPWGHGWASKERTYIVTSTEAGWLMPPDLFCCYELLCVLCHHQHLLEQQEILLLVCLAASVFLVCPLLSSCTWTQE